MNVNEPNTQASNVKRPSEKSQLESVPDWLEPNTNRAIAHKHQEQGRSYASSRLMPMLVLLLLLTADVIVFFNLFID